MNRERLPLSRILTQRLAWITLGVAVINAIAVAGYYGSDRESLETEVVAHMMKRLEQALVGPPPQVDRQARALFRAHPQDYAFALLDRNGRVVDAENVELVPGPAKETGVFAQDWITRVDAAAATLLVASHKVGPADDRLRMVFVMRGDPGGLLRRALLAEFVRHIWLPILPLALILIIANAFMIRRGLSTVARAAEWARQIRPGRVVPELPDTSLPAEIGDLVYATERTLNRLGTALAAERRRAAEVAHALRTPVAVLVARLDALPEGEWTERLRADVAALSRTVRQVLACARADALQLPDSAVADLAMAADKVVATLAPFAYQQGVELSVEVLGAPILAHADQDAVEVALSNLVENAILHAGPGSVEIVVGPDPMVRVRDHGKGLPTQDARRIFEPFWRSEDSEPGGTGLGLAIVERLQCAQGGCVEAKPAEGGGAAFILSFRRPDAGQTLPD